MIASGLGHDLSPPITASGRSAPMRTDVDLFAECPDGSSAEGKLVSVHLSDGTYWLTCSLELESSSSVEEGERHCLLLMPLDAEEVVIDGCVPAQKRKVGGATVVNFSVPSTYNTELRRGLNRRAHPRFATPDGSKLVVRARVRGAFDSTVCEVVDISRTGVALRVPDASRVVPGDTPIEMVVRRPDAPLPVVVQGEVRSVRPDPAGTSVCGVQFVRTLTSVDFDDYLGDYLLACERDMLSQRQLER